MVDQINNGEEGYSVREKLNTVIDRTNTLNGIENQVETNKQNIAKNANQINNLWEHVDDIEDQIQDLDVAVLDSKIDKEIQDRIDGDQSLQDQIDAIDPDGDSSIEWSDIENKPSEFPPSAHGHEIGDVDGLQDALDAAVSDIPPWDYEFTPNTLVLRNDKGDIKGKKVIGQQLQMTTGGSSPPARPDDTIFYSSTTNQLYKNTAEGMRDALDVYSKSEVDELAPSSTLEGTWDYNPASATDGFFTTRNDNWLTATTITLHKFDSTGFEHNFALMNDGDIIYLQTPVGGAEYKVVSKTVNGNTCDFVVDAISYYGPFPVDGESTKINFIPQVSAGSGAGMVLSESEPADKVEGMQWLNPSNGLVLFWDGEKWLQMPTTGAAGKDGADGKDGVDGLWTDNGDTSISYTAGSVGIGVSPDATTGLSLSRDYNLSWQEGSGTSTCNVFRQTQTGSFVISQGYKWSPTNGGFASSQGGEFSRSAVRLGSVIEFYVDPSVNVPEGTDFTPTPRMTIDANGVVSVGEALRIGSGAFNGEPLCVRGNGTSAVWDDGITRTRLARFDNDESEAVRANMMLWSDNNKGAVLQGGTNGGSLSLGTRTGSQDRINMTINANSGITTFLGAVYVEGNRPVISTLDLIETLSTLRNATKDETTLEGLRDSIGNAVGGLIEKFEAMQSEASDE